MTHEQKMRIVQAIRCPRCQHFAWDFTRMEPVAVRRENNRASWHHPACPLVPLPRIDKGATSQAISGDLISAAPKTGRTP
jgi:hypothetical protein